MDNETLSVRDIVKSMGLVFGDIGTSPIWRVFAAIKRLTPPVVQFPKLPADKIHGVVTRVEM